MYMVVYRYGQTSPVNDGRWELSCAGTFFDSIESACDHIFKSGYVKDLGEANKQSSAPIVFDKEYKIVRLGDAF